MTITATANYGPKPHDTAREGETPDPLVLIAGWLAETFCDGDGGPGDIDGFDLQEALVETGFVRTETYDPETHGENLWDLEPGQDPILILEPKAKQALKQYRAFCRRKRGLAPMPEDRT